MELSLKDLKELLSSGAESGAMPFKIGQKLFVRTVTYHLTGLVTAINGKWLTMAKAAWIADSGRFTEAMSTQNFSEVEIFNHEVYLNTDSITDATEIDNLPEVQK